MRHLIALALTFVLAGTARADEPRTLADWSARSEAHARVVAVLEDHARRLEASKADPAAREAEADAVLGRLAECDAAALGELAIGLEADELQAHRLVLARGLAASPAEGARRAVKELLARVPLPAVYLTVLQALPKSPDSVALLLEVLDVAPDGAPRGLLVQELGARDGFAGERRARLVRLLGEESDPAVLGHVLSVAGGTGDRALLEPLRALWERVTLLPIRQRLLVTYAQLGGDEALEFIEEATAGAELALRAAGVLAIGRVGTPAAVERLERIARDDPSEEVRARAARLAAAVRAAAEQRR